jgi:hypothetical protein
MIIAIDPDGIRIIWLDDNIRVVNISPIAGLNKTGIVIGVTLSSMGPILNTTISRGTTT